MLSDFAQDLILGTRVIITIFGDYYLQPYLRKVFFSIIYTLLDM